MRRDRIAARRASNVIAAPAPVARAPAPKGLPSTSRRIPSLPASVCPARQARRQQGAAGTRAGECWTGQGQACRRRRQGSHTAPCNHRGDAAQKGGKDGKEKEEPKFKAEGYDEELVALLERDIVQKNPNVHWSV